MKALGRSKGDNETLLKRKGRHEDYMLLVHTFNYSNATNLPIIMFSEL